MAKLTLEATGDYAGATKVMKEMGIMRPEVQKTLDKLAAVTPEDVRRVARAYLTRNNRTVGVFVPTEEEASEGESPDGRETEMQ